MTKSSLPAASTTTRIASDVLVLALTGVQIGGSGNQEAAVKRAPGALLARGKPIARAILRNARLKRWTLLLLARFPRLYAVAYRTMLQPDAVVAAPEVLPASLSPRAADAYRRLRAYVRQAPQTNSLAPSTRRRLAFVSPLPPERTGVADYAVQLLPAMLSDFDIDLIVDQPHVTLPPALEGLAMHDAAWFDANAHHYDQIIYQFGNSPFHAFMFDLLERHPGVVVLHDFFISGGIAYRQVTGAEPRAWTDALFHSHGYAAVLASQAPGQHSETIKAYPCNLGVLQRATGVIVHSGQSLGLAQSWYGPTAAEKWTVVPLPRAAPTPLSRAVARDALCIPDDVFLVCSFGYVMPIKLVDRLLAAWQASSLHANPVCRLVLVGENNDGPYGAAIAATIAAARGRIQILGWTDEERYRLYLAAADFAVQLRTGSRGETSAAVLDCMNVGLATIVNANGSMADLPEDAVVRLADAFSDDALVAALERLHADAGLRQRIGRRAAALLEAEYRPAACARQYRTALDRAWRMPRESDQFAALPAALLADDLALQQCATDIAAAHVPEAPRQLLIEAGPGATALLRVHVPGWRIELVRLEHTVDGPRYRYARAIAAQALNITPPGPDCAPDWQAGDILYGACDDNARVALDAGLLASLRARGVQVVRLVHAADAASLALLAQADRALCISAEVVSALTPSGVPVALLQGRA